MNQWYLSQNGQATGPFDQQTILEKIKKKEIGHLDLVFKVGTTDWLPLSRVSEFAQAFGLKEDASQDKQTPDWVLLKKVKTEKSSEFKQIGPFTVAQVIELIDQGEVRFSDFAWKKGYPTWAKISEVKEFEKPLPSSPNIDPTIYEKTNTGFEIETLTRQEKNKFKKDLAPFDSEATRVVNTQPIPINSEDFVTESKKENSDQSSDDIQLWSLDSPTKTPIRKSSHQKDESQLSQKKSGSTSDKDFVQKKKKKSKSNSSNSIQPWLLATTALVLSTLFLYLSLKPDESEIIYDPTVVSEIKDGDSKVSVAVPNNVTEETAALDEIKAQEVESEKEINLQRERQERLQAIKDSMKKKAPQEEAEPSPESRQVAQVVSKKDKNEPTEKKEVSKSVKAKPAVEKKKDPVKKAAKAKPAAKVTAVKKAEVVNTIKGSKKDQSFYKHRERKALFYSSIRAETLAVDIEGQFKKLQKNKPAWNRYYGQWKKKVATSLASEIRNFPSRNEKYAYPKILDSFKKDYQLFYKYGEVFNSKVNGRRIPADAPEDIKTIFTRYKEQAKNLTF